MLRGVRSFLSEKYDITKHPRYKYLSDADDKNIFGIEKYVARHRRPPPPVAPDEPFGFYGTEDEPSDADTIVANDTEPIA